MTPSLDEFLDGPDAARKDAIDNFLDGPDEANRDAIDKFLDGPDAEQQPAPVLAPAYEEARDRVTSFSLPQAYELARERDPERTARVLDLSSVLSSPPDVVDRNLDKASAAATARENAPDFARLAAEAPATARHLAIPTNMAVSKDDTENMGAVESFFKKSPYTYGFRMLARGYMQSVQSSLKLLDDASKLAQRGLQAVGVPEEYAKRGGAFEDAQAAYAPPAWAPAPKEFSGKLMAAVGRLPLDLGILMMLSKLPGGAATAMGLEGAVHGGAEDGWTGAAAGGVHGALTGGILSAFGYLPRLAQAPAAGAFGYGMTLHETGDQDEALAQGLVFAGFHAPQFLKGLSDIYDKSKTLARSPRVAEAHAAEVLKEAGYPETAYLSARDVHTVFEQYLQTEGNGRLKKFLGNLEISMAEFEDAGRMDMDLTFPAAKVVWLHKTPEGKALLERLKWTPFADERRAQELLAQREQAQAGPEATAEAPAEGQAAGNVLDLSGVVPGDAVVNPSDLLRRAGLDPAAVSQAPGPIADAPMPVADIAADPRFQGALKLLNYDGVRFGEAAKPAEVAAPVEAPVLLTRKGGAYSEGEALAKLEELKKQGVTTSMTAMEEGGYGLAVDAVEQPQPAQVRQTIETAMALAVQGKEAPYEVIGVVEPDVARRIKENTGQDALVFRHVIDPSFIHHVLARHGIGNEKEPGHRGVEPKDILRVPDVLLHPDDVQTGSRPGNVVFVKRVNGTIYYVESARPGSRTLEPRTMWIRDAKTPASPDAPGNPEPRPERPKRLAGSKENIRQGEAEGKGAEAEDMDVVWPDHRASGSGIPERDKANAATSAEPPGQRITVSGRAGKAAAKDGPVKALFDTLDPLQARAENALPVEIALTADHISVPEARQAALDNPSISAITLPGDRVIFIADRTASPEEAVKRWVHEQGIHQGLRVFLGKDLDTWRDGLVKTYGADGLREVAEAHGIDLSTPEGLRRAAEERFALIADKALLEQALSPEEATLWQRFVQMFRDGLRRRGMIADFTDAEIAKLARDSLRATLGRERPARDGGQLQPRDVVELALARETMGMERAFEDPDVLGLAASDPEMAAELREYDWLWNEAGRQAGEQMDRTVARERAKEDKVWRAEANESYEQTPGWQAYARIVEAGGLSESVLRQIYDGKLIAALKRAANRFEGHKEGNRRQKLVAKENERVSPEELARELGGEAGDLDGLVQFLLAQEGRNDFVDRTVASRRLIVEDVYRSEEAIATDAYERALTKQAEIFGKLLGKKPRGMSEIKRTIEEQTGVRPWTQAISESDALVASLKRQQEAARVAFREGMKEGRGEAKAEAREKMAAERQKRIQDGFEATERLREAVARVKERVRVKEETAKALQKVHAAVDSPTVDGEFSEHIRAIAARFGFVSAKSKMPKDPGGMRPLREILEETLPPDSLVGMVVPEKFLDPNFRKNWRDMTFDELVEVGSVLDALAQIGRTKNRALSYQSKLTFDRMADIASSFTAAHKKKVGPDDPGHYVIPERPGPVQKILDGRKELRAALTNVEHIFRAADGWKEGHWKGEGPFGPNYEFGFLPMVRAWERELSLSQEYNNKFKEIFKPLYGESGDFGKTKTMIEGVPLLWSRENMIMLALNCGNEGNLKTIREGMGLNDIQIRKVTDQLTKKEWDFVANVWDLFESLYPKLDAEYRKIYGRPLPKVERTPWETPYGTVQGGYFPIVADPRRSKKAEMYSDLEAQRASQENGWQRQLPRDSMLKTRTGSVQAPRLEFDVIHNHLRESIHNISFAVPMRDVYRFVQHPIVEKSITDYVGEERYKEIVPWVQSIAADGRPIRPDQMKMFDRILEWTRRNTSATYLGLSVPLAVLQPTALLPVFGEVPAPYILGSLKQFISHPAESMKVASELSIFIKARGETFDRDIRDACKSMDVTGYRVKIYDQIFSGDDIRNALYFFTRTTDVWTASVAFDAAYKYGLKKYAGNETFAKDFAESVVRRTQGDGSPISLARIQRGAPAFKLFTMFYSYFNAIGNRMMEHTERLIEKDISKEEFGRQIAWTIIVPAIAEALLRSLMSEDWRDPKKALKETAKGAAYNVMGYPFSTVVFARDVANPILMQMITGKNYGYQGSPAGKLGDEVLRLAVLTTKVANGDMPDNVQEQYMRSLIMLSSHVSGVIPGKQLWTSFQGARDMATGKTKDPRRLLFAGQKD